MTRIACLGGNLESEVALNGLLAADAEIVGIFCADPILRPRIADYAAIDEIAGAHGIPCLPITDINTPDARAFAAAIEADYLFVLGWSQIIAPEALACFDGGVIGSHPAPLPFGKGRAPVPWTVLENRRRSAVTLFEMTPKIDEGRIVSMRWFDIPERPYAADVYALVADALRESFVALAGSLRDGPLPHIADSGLEPSIYARRTPQDGWIDFSGSADAIDRLVRAVSRPYPGAYAYFGGGRVAFHRAEPAAGKDLQYHGQPGQVLRKRGGMLLVQCGDVPQWIGNNAEDSEWNAIYGGIALGARFGMRVEDELHGIAERLLEVERRLGIK